MSKPDVKTDEKKQHFDDIYVAEDPVPYKERIMDALAYVSDNFNQQTFDRLILPWAQQKAAQAIFVMTSLDENNKVRRLAYPALTESV